MFKISHKIDGSIVLNISWCLSGIDTTVITQAHAAGIFPVTGPTQKPEASRGQREEERTGLVYDKINIIEQISQNGNRASKQLLEGMMSAHRTAGATKGSAVSSGGHADPYANFIHKMAANDKRETCSNRFLKNMLGRHDRH